MAHQIQDGDRWAIAETASRLGVKPADLLAMIAYETSGTFSPDKIGGTNNLYQGLIQMGAEERHQFKYSPTDSFAKQVRGPVYSYLKTRGVKPGMGLDEMYAIIDGGSLKYKKDGTVNYDIPEKGTGRTIKDNINNIKKDWLAPAQQLFWTSPQFLQQYWTRYPPYDPTTGEVKTARLPTGFGEPDKLSSIIAKFVPEPVRAAVQMWAALSPEEQAAKEEAIASGEKSPETPRVASADVPIPRANPRMEEANQRIADAERIASETSVVARYNPSASAFVPTEHASPALTTALGYTYQDRPGSSGAASAIESLSPTGTEGVRERAVSPTSVPSASALDWNDASSLRTNMGAPAQPAYNPLSSARTAQPAAPVATPTPTPATPPPQPVETPQTATVSPTSVPSTTYPDQIKQPGFTPPQEVAASTIPQPYDPLSSINAPVQPAYDPLSSVQPKPVPGTGPVEPPVTKQPNAPVTGSARKAAPAAAPPAIRKPSAPVKATVPNARSIHPDVQPLVLRSITGVSGPGPFNKATVQQYLSQQQWHAPNFDAKSGGSTYPYFTDHASGIGGYVTSTGKAYTYSLRSNPGQSSTGMTGDEARAAAYNAAHP